MKDKTRNVMDNLINRYPILNCNKDAIISAVNILIDSFSTGGKIKSYSDILINVKGKETYRVQELHLPVYHAICLALEEEFFGVILIFL